MNSVIDKANSNLTSMFGAKHTPITLDDINKTYKRQLLNIDANAKTAKGTKHGYLTGILYLAPAKISGIEVCPGRSAGCTAACLFTAGRGRFYSVTRARVIKTLALHLNKLEFYRTLDRNINTLVATAKRNGLVPVVRLNGTSDLDFTQIIAWHPEVQFYDYTKVASRLLIKLPNYHLTYSLSDRNSNMATLALAKGYSVAAVFNQVPKEYLGFKVIPGDDSDLRFLDERGVIVGLTAKGAAKRDKTGFVQIV